MSQKLDSRQLALDSYNEDRLSHMLPDFTRTSWVSDDTRAVWEPRIGRISTAWAAMEWHSILAGVRPCCLTTVAAERIIEAGGEWARHGLAMLPVAMSAASHSYASTMSTPRSGEPFEYRVAVGGLENVTQLKRAIDAGDNETMGKLLGYPPCCLTFFRDTWVDYDMVDTTWPMAAASGTYVDRTVEIDGGAPLQANILLRWIGMRAVPHLPCSFHCPATVVFGEKLMTVGRKLGFVEEMEWLEEILQWPVEWSALHGIAEVKTPVLKVSTRSDATAHKFVVRKLGNTMPEETVSGLVFPFKEPNGLKATDSSGFAKGLSNPIEEETVVPDWYAADNGFSTRAAMDEAQRPIVELAVELLGDSGTVLDLGCGNGVLLNKIRDQRPGVIPFGVDFEAERVAHAGELLPEFKQNFLAGSMFDGIPMDMDTVYSIIIFMPGRLLEVTATKAARLKNWLSGHFEYLLIYGYGEWLTGHDGLAGLAEKTGLELLEEHPSGTVGLARFVKG
ncbi:MAG: methionine biosynthesis protein MetW [Thermodesulfobacteriota bacterium]